MTVGFSRNEFDGDPLAFPSRNIGSRVMVKPGVGFFSIVWQGNPGLNAVERGLGDAIAFWRPL